MNGDNYAMAGHGSLLSVGPFILIEAVLFILKTLNPANHPVIVTLLFILAITSWVKIAPFAKSWPSVLGVFGLQFLKESDGIGYGRWLILWSGFGERT